MLSKMNEFCMACEKGDLDLVKKLYELDKGGHLICITYLT